jgi:RHS repeat-associated protein
MYLTYDIENRMIQGPGGYYAYDHAGKRVKKTVTGAEEFYFYGINGKRLATTVCTGEDDGTGCQPRIYDVNFGGKLVKSRGAVVATDRLGSVRASSTGDQMTYYPYGEERTSTADGRDKFGTYMRDSVTQDYADQRYYAVGMGRFGTPDPGGLSVTIRTNPLSWNQYSYTYGDPVNMVDLTGAATCLIYGDPSFCSDGAGTSGGGDNQGMEVEHSGEYAGTGGDSRYWDGQVAAGATTYVMRGILHDTINRTDPKCFDALSSALGITKDKLSADADKLMFFDSQGAAGALTLFEVLPTGVLPAADGNTTVAAHAATAAAVGATASTLGYVGKDGLLTLTANVFLTSVFWTRNDPGSTLFHELFHYSTQLSDSGAALALNLHLNDPTDENEASKALNGWLHANGCQK